MIYCHPILALIKLNTIVRIIDLSCQAKIIFLVVYINRLINKSTNKNLKRKMKFPLFSENMEDGFSLSLLKSSESRSWLLFGISALLLFIFASQNTSFMNFLNETGLQHKHIHIKMNILN